MKEKLIRFRDQAILFVGIALALGYSGILFLKKLAKDSGKWR